MTESIKELRQICQQSREDEFYRMPWLERNVTRKISIYFTRLLLQMGVSANQASFIGWVVSIVGGFFLLFPSPVYWFIGIAILFLWELFTCTDGEIARYNKSSSPTGAFCNSMPENFGWLYTPACLSFGLYNALHRIDPFIISFLAIMAISLTANALLLPYPILHRKGLLPEPLSVDKAVALEEHTNIIIRHGRFLAHFNSLLSGLLIATIIDSFISSFTIASFAFNARYVVFAFFTLLWVVSAIRNVYIPVRTGIRLRL